MFNLTESKESLLKTAKTLVETAKTEKREMSASELEQYDKCVEQIERIKKTESAVRSVETRDDNYGQYLRTGQGLEYRDLQSGSGVGANLVPGLIGDQVVNVIKQYDSFRNVATVITTANGQSMPFPLSDDTSQIGEIVSEGSAATTTSTDPTLSQVAVAPVVFSSKYIVISLSLIQDSAFNAEAYVNKIAGERIGRIEQATATANVLASAGASGLTVDNDNLTFYDLINIVHAVDPAHRQSPNFGIMVSDDTLAIMKKMVDGNNRPLFLPSVAEREAGTINGYRIIVNQSMPEYSGTNKAILVGDFSKVLVRDVAGLEIVRDAYGTFASKRQVAFVMFHRSCAKLLDSSAVKSVTLSTVV